MALTVPNVQPLVDAYLALEGNASGGSLHIVLSDYNIETSHIEFCRTWADEHNDERGVRLATILLRMSKTQRNKLAHRSNPSNEWTAAVDFDNAYAALEMPE